MPTITFRVSEKEKAELAREAKNRDVSLSDVVREGLGLRDANVDQRLAELERRVERLENVAGL
jgi:hypothetical protein